MREEIEGCRRGQGVIILLLIMLLGGCGGSGTESQDDSSASELSDDDSIDGPITLARPEQLIVQSLSATSIEVSWQPSENVAAETTYHICRDSMLIGSNTGTLFTDIGLAAGQPYSYTV